MRARRYLGWQLQVFIQNPLWVFGSSRAQVSDRHRAEGRGRADRPSPDRVPGRAKDGVDERDRVGAAGFIVPFMFYYSPILLWKGSLADIVQAEMDCASRTSVAEALEVKVPFTKPLVWASVRE